LIVLDTSAWIRWVAAPSQPSARARRAILAEEPKHGLVVSAISVWEVATKVALGKLSIDRDVRQWVALASAYPGVVVAPLDPLDALESALLPEPLHRDPADRLIIALARRLRVGLVTSDSAIRACAHVRSVW
jgi:PIN domain nuclease of toxin-antitoxin system